MNNEFMTPAEFSAAKALMNNLAQGMSPSGSNGRAPAFCKALTDTLGNRFAAFLNSGTLVRKAFEDIARREKVQLQFLDHSEFLPEAMQMALGS